MNIPPFLHLFVVRIKKKAGEHPKRKDFGTEASRTPNLLALHELQRRHLGHDIGCGEAAAEQARATPLAGDAKRDTFPPTKKVGG